MLKKALGLITNNFGLKVLGIVFAIALWMVIVNVEDPDKSMTFSIDVNVVNADFLTDIGKTYEILEGTDTISFTVTGKRSIVENLDVSDFKAVANLENIDDSMSMVPIVITATSYSSQLEITKRNSYLLVNVENLVTQEFEVEVVVSGTPATDCFVSALSSSVDTIQVEGPESVVAQIASVQAEVDVDGATEQVAVTQNLVLLDANGNEVSTERLTLEERAVVATVDILMEKELDIAVSVSGTPKEGYRYTDISCDCESVLLVGDWAVLNAMSELAISSSKLSLDDVEDTFTEVLTLADYLPEGVSLADGEAEEISVTVVMEGQVTIEGEMPVSNITVSGLDGDKELTFNSSDSVSVSVTGYEEDLNKINIQKLSGTLDASNLSVGIHAVSIVLDVDDTVEAEARAIVTITEND